MAWLSTVPQSFKRKARHVWLEAKAGAEREHYLRDWLRSQEETGTVTAYVRCDAAFGGPWAGVTELLRLLAPRIEKEAPELIDRHNHELLQVLPTMRSRLAPKLLTLTDIAFAEEKVRNYPMDRAYRIVHGLIDLLAAWHEKAGFRQWTIVCDSFDAASALGGRFFRELARRRGKNLCLTLVLAGDLGSLASTQAEGTETLWRVRPPLPPEEELRDDATTKEESRRRAEALALEFSRDHLKFLEQLSELIYHWQRSDTPEKALIWQAWAFAEANHAGFYEDALPYGRAALGNIDPICAQTIFTRWNLVGGMCNCYLALSQPEKAREIVEKEALQKVRDPTDLARIHYVLAMIHARFLPKADLAAAENYLDKGLFYLESDAVGERDRSFLKVFLLNGLAFIRHRQGKPQEALDLCRSGFDTLGEKFTTTKHRLHRSVLLYNTGQVYVAMGDTRRGIECYTEASEMDPNYSEYHNERGNLHLQLSELDQAIADYHSAIATSPPYWEVWSNLGQTYKLQGRLPEAIAAYDRAIDIDPGQLLPWLGRAQAHEASGRPEAALADYSAALELDPQQPLALSNRAEIRYSLGQLAEALGDLDRAIALDPGNAGLFFNRSVAHADLGDAERAASDLRAYLELEPDAGDRAEVEQRICALA